MQSQTMNERITTNGVGQIVVNHLKFDLAKPSEEVFFVYADNATFQVAFFAMQHLSKLTFSIPEVLLEGNYTLIVKKPFVKTALTLRKRTLPFILKVF